MTIVNHESSESGTRRGVLLLAHGAPDRLEDIPEFLLNVRGGRPLPEPAVKEIIHRYSLIGGGSPLLKLTTLQSAALAEALNQCAGADVRPSIPVYIGMRNWKPYIADAIGQAVNDGVGRLVALCLAPQNSRTSVGLYRKHLDEAVVKTSPHLQVDFIESWHDQPDLIAAFAERISDARKQAETEAGGPVPIIFTAHSVPGKTVADGDPYEQQVKETAALVAGAMALKEFRVAFQSQGMTADPWIGPTVESQIDELAAAGHHQVLIAPIGFVCDHVEILYDIDVVFRDYGKSRGVAVYRSRSLNDSPLFIRALAAVVSAREGSHVPADRSAGIS
ncbi:MAG TPA: ferrochelatase [Terriglobia bacterium]|nr:ferrochelatase [Terriglobia bacterium]